MGRIKIVKKAEEEKVSKKLKFETINETPLISQTFISLEGEGNNAGEPSLYIRFAGCFSAACEFCDTKFSWFKKEKYPKITENDGNIGTWIDSLDSTQFSKVNRLTITGGEPLHYLPFLINMDKVILKLRERGLNITWLGIESNGNLLSDKDNIILLIKSFKNLEKINVKTHLTISPKLNSSTCYANQITQPEINNMYKKVIKNVEGLFPYPVYYKFVWNVSEYDNKLVLDVLEHLKEEDVENKRIFLMPYTPVDPLKSGNSKWEKSKKITAIDALHFGVRFSPRLHIDLELD